MAFSALRRLTGSLTAVRDSLESTVGIPTGLSPVAVDFGVSSLKVLQVNLGEQPSLVACGMIETPETVQRDHAKRLAFQLEHLPRLIRQGGFKGKRAVCAIPASQTFCKHMQLPKVEGLAVGDAVRSTIAAQMNCDPEALVYRHFEVNGAAATGKTEVIGLAVPRELVVRLMEGLRRAKVEMVGMHSEYAATLAAFDSLARRSEDTQSVMLYIDLGWATTKVTIAHGRDLVFARTIEMGGMHLDDAVAGQTQSPPSVAHGQRLAMESLTRGKDAPADTGEPDLTEALESITDEIALSLRYHQSLFPGMKIARAVFVGGESRHAALCRHVAKVLRLPAQTGDPMARVSRTGKEPMTGVDLRGAQPGWAVPLGLCLSKTDL